MMVMVFVTEWFYPVICEVWRRGETPGKTAMGIAVVRFDGTAVGWSQSIVRNLVRVADFLPLFYLVGLVSMLLGDRFQRLGDLAAGTVVVYRDATTARRFARLAVTPEPPALALELAEQRAIVDFADRVPLLSVERADELARLAAPLCHATPEPARLLCSVAAWLEGARPSEGTRAI